MEAVVTAAQLGNPNAVAIDSGITFQAVLVNSTAPFMRLGSEGSPTRNIPTESAVNGNWNGTLDPSLVITSTAAVPDVPNSDGSTMLIWPPVPATIYSGIAVPFTSTDSPSNDRAGKIFEAVF